MQFRIGTALLSLALAVSLSAVALAQAENDGPTSNSASAPGSVALAPGQMPAPELFLQLTTPAETDLTVPVETAALTVQGMTVPGAVVSVDGDLADVDAQGNFTDVAGLTEGANAIDVVASDDQGNQMSTTLYVVRGE
jgi:uncharacterized protein YfaP (DUF2135 family)